MFAFYAYTYLASNDSWIQHTGKSLEHALVQCHEPNNVANTYMQDILVLQFLLHSKCHTANLHVRENNSALFILLYFVCENLSSLFITGKKPSRFVIVHRFYDMFLIFSNLNYAHLMWSNYSPIYHLN